METRTTRFTGDVWLTGAEGGDIGAKRIALLEAIDAGDSISAAARQLGIGYRTAWNAVDEMNNLWDRPLVRKSPGGAHGGGTRLTGEGHRLVAAFRLMQQEYARYLAGLNRKMSDLDHFQQAIRRLTMRTSARNQFQGRVDAIHTGPVNAEVTLTINERDRLTAVVTTESVEALGLALGSEAYALIKASFIVLAADDDACITSARNRLCGEVAELHHGPVNTEVAIALEGGKTLTAVVTEESSKRLGLAPGSRACALFKASHVILGVN